MGQIPLELRVDATVADLDDAATPYDIAEQFVPDIGFEFEVNPEGEYSVVYNDKPVSTIDKE